MLWTYFNGAAAFLIGIAAHMPVAADVDAAAAMSLPSSAIGCVSAVLISDTIFPSILRQKKISVSRGGQIIRAAQIGAFAIPTLLSLGLHFAIANTQLHPDKDPAPLPDSQIQTSDAMTPPKPLRMAEIRLIK